MAPDSFPEKHTVTERELRILRGLREGRECGRITPERPVTSNLIALAYSTEYNEPIRSKDIPTYVHALREVGYPIGVSPAGGYFYALTIEEGEYTKHLLRRRAFSSFRGLAGFLKAFSTQTLQDELGQLYLDLTNAH